MKQNHFFYPYSGNKRNEVERIYNLIEDKINSKTIIVEPFCGSAACSYYIWTKNKDIKFVLNDNDKLLIELYELSKNEEELKKFHEKLIKLHESINNKEDYAATRIKSKYDLISYVYVRKIYKLHYGNYVDVKTSIRKYDIEFKNFIKAPIIDFIRNANIKFENMDGVEFYKTYKNNKNAIIFIDPPYLDSYNGCYSCPDANIYEYFYYNKIKKEKAKIILCLNNNWIIRMLFESENKEVYEKQYSASKRKVEHVNIYNFKKV